MAKKVNEPSAINVYFSPKLRADGELLLVRIKQGEAEIQLTKEQALALVDQINARHR